MSARASGETVTESQNKKVSVADNHSVTMKCTATFVTRYNASKKRRLCLGVIKNPSGFIKQVSLSFEFYCNTGGGIEVR